MPVGYSAVCEKFTLLKTISMNFYCKLIRKHNMRWITRLWDVQSRNGCSESRKLQDKTENIFSC